MAAGGGFKRDETLERQKAVGEIRPELNESISSQDFEEMRGFRRVPPQSLDRVAL